MRITGQQEGCLLWLKRCLWALGIVIFASGAALAGAFDAEKKAGLVGEQANGYIGVVANSASPALVRQVDELNLKRRQHYRDIAKKNGTNLAAVEAIFGKKLIDRAASGEFVNPGGGWTRKP